MKDEQIRKWEDAQEFGNDLIIHFEDDFNRWDWYEIAQEGRRINDIMFEEEIEQFSPMDDIFTAMVAQAAKGALASIAAMLGLDGKILESVVSYWYDYQDNLPESISFERFMELYKQHKEVLEKIKRKDKK